MGIDICVACGRGFGSREAALVSGRRARRREVRRAIVIPGGKGRRVWVGSIGR